MHELSLMKNILRIAGSAALSEGEGGRVELIHLRIGEMSGVCEESLRFAFQVLTEGTICEGARLGIERVPLRVTCRGCGSEYHPDEFTFVCRECGSPKLNIDSGREMEIDYILTDERAGNKEKVIEGDSNASD